MLSIIEHGPVTEIKTARTFLGRPVYFNSFYIVDGLMIDTGPAHVSAEVAAVLKRFPIQQAAVTHHHEDHYGNCRLVREQLGIPVYAHPLTLKTMAATPAIQYYRKFMWGDAPPSEGLRLNGEIKTPRFRFLVVDTPGHAPGHVSFFEPQQRWLFCGDLYLGEKLTGFMEGENIAEHLASLKKVISLDPEILFCGLKGRLNSAVERLKKKEKFWLELGREAIKLSSAGASGNEIMKRLLGGETAFYYLSQRNWGRKHLIDSLLDNRDLF